jgi:HAE1 family hydrophobic/amphiphilic exporter-1
MTKFALQRPVTIIMAFLGITLIGVISWQRLRLELLPSLNIPQITVVTSYENTPPEEMESLVTKPVEGALAGVSNVKRIRSVSREGVSLVTLDFNWGTEMNFAALDVREKLDLIRDTLPRDAKSPVVMKYDPSTLPVLALNVSGEQNLLELRRIAQDQIKRDLERIDGVASATVTGGLEREILVSVDQGRLMAHRIPLNALLEELKNANFNFPGGKIETRYTDLRIRTLGEFEKIEDMERVVVGWGKGNSPVYLKDVAIVKDTHKEPKNLSRVNGKSSVVISVLKAADANTVQVAENVHKEIDRINKQLRPKAEMTVAYDQSRFIKASIRDLREDGILGGILAFLVILFSLESLGSALIIATALPISILTTFSLMYMNGMTLNIMSLGGLALGIGDIMDSGIVVLENTARLRGGGMPVRTAILTGADEMRRPVMASIFSHIVIFLPILFMKGISGQFFAQLAITISFSLIISLFVAFTLIPTLEVYQFRRPMEGPMEGIDAGRKGPHGSGPWRWISSFLSPLFRGTERGIVYSRRVYERILRWALDRPGTVLVLAFVLLAISVALLTRVGREFIPKADQGQFVVKVTAPPSSSLTATEGVVDRIEKMLLGMPEIERVVSSIGSTGEEGIGFQLESTGLDTAQIMVTLKDRRERERSVEVVVNDLRARTASLKDITVEYILQQDILQFSRQMGKAPEILEIKGDDREPLRGLTQEIMEKMRQMRGLTDIEWSLSQEGPEVRIEVDRPRAASLQLTAKDIGETLRTAVEGSVATQFREEDKEVDIRVRLREIDREGLPDLERVLIYTPAGESVPLSTLARVVEGQTPGEIQRRDQSRVIVISANLVGRKLDQVTEELEGMLKTIRFPEGYSYRFTGEVEEMRESSRSLFLALAFAVLIVYMILASQFESFLYPFIILFSIPFSVVGVTLALLITQKTLSLGVYIGAILLAGIVVNNAIILIDCVIQLRKEERPLLEALVEAGRLRFRPILMTAATTVLGTLPLGFSWGEGSEIRSPMAIAVVGGMTTSTLLTLVIVPVIYLIVERVRGILKRGIRGSQG